MSKQKFIEIRMPIPVNDEVYAKYENMKSETHQKWARWDLSNLAFELVMKYAMRKMKVEDEMKESHLCKLITKIIEVNDKEDYS